MYLIDLQLVEFAEQTFLKYYYVNDFETVMWS